MNYQRRRYITSLVRQLLRDYQVAKPPVPVEAIIEKHGIRIQAQALGENIFGFLYRGTKPEDILIGVNASNPPVRKRFTVAHELGHHLLGHKSVDVYVDRKVGFQLRGDKSSKGTNPEEIEANLFAAELLMPQDLLAKDIPDNARIDPEDEETIGALAKRYQVSMQALTIRLGALGYIPQ